MQHEMKQKYTSLALLGLILSLILMAMACDPAKRLRRICKNNPGVCISDTVLKTIHDTIPGIDTGITFTVDTTTTGLDSLVKTLLSEYKRPPMLIHNLPISRTLSDSLKAKKTVNLIKQYINNRLTIKDTLRKEIDGVIIKVYQSAKNEIRMNVTKAPVVVVKTIPVEENILIQECSHKATWYDITCYIITGIVFGALLVILFRLGSDIKSWFKN